MKIKVKLLERTLTAVLTPGESMIIPLTGIGKGTVSIMTNTWAKPIYDSYPNMQGSGSYEISYVTPTEQVPDMVSIDVTVDYSKTESVDLIRREVPIQTEKITFEDKSTYNWK